MMERVNAEWKRAKRAAWAVAALLVPLAAAPAVIAQDTSAVFPGVRPVIPAPGETDNGPVFATSLNSLHYFFMSDPVSHRELISPQYPVYYDTPLHPTVVYTPKSNGADLTITYTNTTTAPARLGTIAITGIQFPLGMKFWQFGQDTKPLTFDSYAKQGNDLYPGGVYSPLTVLGDNLHTIGIALLYPAVLYDQQIVKFVVAAPLAPGGDPTAPRPWAAGFRLEANLAPGATRTYTLTVRAIRAGGNWLHTAVPYRDYFQWTYGPVKYARDARSVLGQAAAFLEFVTPTNPRGYAGQDLRPDLNGWKPWADRFRLDASRGGFGRVMLWNPSGVFNNSPLNFPFQFMTGMLPYPVAASTLHELAALRTNPGLEVGFWWGHSLSVMEQWNPTTGHNLNPYNQADVDRAFAELNIAVAAGASIIGLDAFKMPSPAAQYFWLQQMRVHSPGIKFVQENAASDIFHNLSPTFHEANVIVHPHILGDLLNPGHETWAAITEAGKIGGRRNTMPILGDEEVERVRDLGFVPLTYGWTPRTARPAAESWMQTIPESIRRTDISLSPEREAALRRAPRLPPEMEAAALRGRRAAPPASPERAVPAPALAPVPAPPASTVGSDTP